MNKLVMKLEFGVVHKVVMKDNTLSIGAKGLYAYLCAYAGNDGSAFPGRDLITYELNIGKDTLGKYMKELKEAKYIHVVQEKEEGKFAHNIYHLTPDKEEPYPEISDTVDKDTTINNNTKNKITKNNNNNSATDNNEAVDKIWSLYPVKKGKATAIKKIPKIIKEIGEDQLIRCIERYKSTFKNGDYTFMKHGSTFFNGGYLDYTDENYQESKNIERKNNTSSLNAEQKPKRKYGF